jgi:hypothetical protein
MQRPTIKATLAYILAISVSIALLFFVVMVSWIGYEVKQQCRQARTAYGGDCVAALANLLEDESRSFRDRNEAVWALGRLGDQRALPALERYYTGRILSRESLDHTLSQYELRKAVNLSAGGGSPMAWLWRGLLAEGGRTSGPAITTETLIVAEKSDPYYSLAQEIAAEEGLEMVETFDEVLQNPARFVLLVAAPERLSPDRLAQIGELFQDQNYYPGLGIISGSTMEKARQLWARRDQAKAGNNYLGGDVDILQQVYAPTIFDISEGAYQEIALNKDNLIHALEQADYFYWSRHTGPRDWSWNEEYGDWTEDDQLRAADIPALKPAVIYSLTCSPFRPWVEDSIALGFVDHGAAAYLGFVNTPHTVTFSRDGLSVPGLTTWSEFPLGLAAQIHNKVAAETVFTSPQLFMLGDPRVYLAKDQPYRITSDRVTRNGRRILTGASDESSILAVKIDGGAAYRFVSLRGVTSASDEDVFYNNKLQTLDLGEDKYLLFAHPGGDFELRLSRHNPPGWAVADAVVDAFDFSWVVLWLSTYADGNPQLLLVSLPVFLGILLFKTLKQKQRLRAYTRVFLFALAFALARLGYFLLRVDEYTISANLAVYTPGQIALGGLGVFAGVAGGLMLMRDSSRRVVKLLGLALAVSRQLWMAGFYLAFITLLNALTPITKNTQPWLLSYDNFWLALVVLVFEVMVIFAAYRYWIRARKTGA